MHYFLSPFPIYYWWSNDAYTDPKLPYTPYLPFHVASLIQKIAIWIQLFNSFHSFLTSNLLSLNGFSKSTTGLAINETYPYDSSHIVSLSIKGRGEETQAMGVLYLFLQLGCGQGLLPSSILEILQWGLTGG